MATSPCTMASMRKHREKFMLGPSDLPCQSFEGQRSFDLTDYFLGSIVRNPLPSWNIMSENLSFSPVSAYVCVCVNKRTYHA